MVSPEHLKDTEGLAFEDCLGFVPVEDLRWRKSVGVGTSSSAPTESKALAL